MRGHGPALTSKNEDFVTRSNLSADGPPLIWIRIGDTGTARLRQQFGPLMPDIIGRPEQKARLIKVARWSRVPAKYRPHAAAKSQCSGQSDEALKYRKAKTARSYA